MKKILLIIAIVLLAGVTGAEAANWYVRPSGGSGAGTSWTAAWNGLGGISWASVNCGDTVWIAGGTYNGTFSMSKSCTAGTVLSVRRARSDSTACTGASGWDSSYDSTVNQVRVSSADAIVLSGSYGIVSGRASDDTQGWLVDSRSLPSGSRAGYGMNGGIANGTVEYIEIVGGGTSQTVDGNMRGLNAASNATYAYLKIHGMSSGIYSTGNSNTVFDHLDIYDNTIANVATYHNNGIYITGGSDNTIRYSRFHGHNGQMIFLANNSTGTRWRIYGNMVYDSTITGDTGIKIREGSTAVDWRVYNNTFYNITQTPSFYVDTGGVCSGGEIRNNLLYSTNGLDTCGTMSDNTTAGSNPFVNLAARNFHLLSATSAGYLLASPYDADPDGNIRGSDGVWDRGAYEYGGSAPSYWTVTAAYGSGGTMSCISPVNDGETTTCTAASSLHYHVNSIAGCGGTWGGGSSYTTGAITANCTVTAAFVLDTYTITPIAGNGGQISPGAPTVFGWGTVANFTIIPDSGYRVRAVRGCGGEYAGGNYVTAPISGECTVTAYFRSNAVADPKPFKFGGSGLAKVGTGEGLGLEESH